MPEARAEYEARPGAMQQILAEALRQSRRPEVVILVHGFRTTFDDGRATLADIWHFARRITVYMNKRDNALALVQTLMSGGRMGRMSIRDMDERVRDTFSPDGERGFHRCGAAR